MIDYIIYAIDFVLFVALVIAIIAAVSEWQSAKMRVKNEQERLT